MTVPGWHARIAAGMTGGVAGGAAFGVLMHISGVLPMAAGLVDEQSIAVDWVVHLSIAAVIGLVFAVITPMGRHRTGHTGAAANTHHRL